MRNNSSSRFVKRLSGLVVGALAVTSGLLGFGHTSPAVAAPLPGDPATVTAEALPNWQINGVVWSQVTVGNTVYATGDFTKARPPGEAAGSPLEIAALNIFAFDVRTGNPVPFSHSLNGQGLIIRANEDGSRVYVGGDFTSVDGVARSHIASFDTATGQLNNFNARTDGQVRGLATIGNTVYAAGNFYSSNGQPRTLFAAYDAANGNLKPWAPVGDGGYVWTMVASPDGSRLIAGGSFTTINGTDAYGMGAIDATTGANLPWAANARLRAAGANGAIDTLSTDGTNIYGAGYSFGAGAAFEGTFSANATTGAINWVNDCLGDTYDTFPMGGVLYTVSHDHDCTVAGGFPDTSPRSRWQKASAERTEPIGTITTKDAYNWDYTGLPYTGQLHWYPDLEFGTYTSARQAAWSISGNSDYIVLGGEFPKVNNLVQQGLVRFAKKPTSLGTKPIAGATSTPVPVPVENGVVKVVFGAMWDRDDATIEYDIFRNSGAKIATISRNDSEFWKLPLYTFTDTGAAPGSQVRYQVRARDAAGNAQFSAWSPYVTVTAPAQSAYRDLLAGQGAAHLWRLGEPATGTLMLESLGDVHGVNTGETQAAAGALLNETDAAITGTASGKITTSNAQTAPSTFTVEAWVKTTSTRGGRIVGFGQSPAATSVQAFTDRVLYLDNSGRANFMVNDTAVRTVTSRSGINDGQWHHVAGTVDANGMQLFVDGVRVGRDQRYNAPKTYEGYWRIGADQTNGFTNKPSDQGLAGSIDEVAVTNRALTVAEVQSHVTASGRTGAWTAQPADGYAAAVNADKPEIFWRLGTTSGSYLDSSGSGAYGNSAGNNNSISRGVAGAISGDTAATFDGSSGLVVAQHSWATPGPYSAEVWFKTNSTRGGKLVGFGNATSGLSSSYDRHIYMQSGGKLSFGSNGNGQQSIVTPLSYNNNQWHHAVATQGADGMKLYVDGLLVGTNPTTSVQSYSGYWRIGGDRTWGSTQSNYIAGTLDEVAIYPSVLSENAVRAHYNASGRVSPNRPPVAAFTASKSYLNVSVDGSTSSDPDGPVAQWAWNFGDGATATGATATHAYAAAGTYNVTLTVTDEQGLTKALTQQVTVAPNQAPTAAFTSTVNLHAVSLDASGSTDSDGSVAGYAWDFGDGATGTGVNAGHTYANAGTYQVTLTVTDDLGLTRSITHPVVAVDPVNQLPTAAFAVTTHDLEASFDGTGSSDPDGTVDSWAWNFGDNTTGNGQTPVHNYEAAGTYAVTLTVTDNRGGTSTVSHDVVVLAPNVNPVAGFTWTANDEKISFDGSGSSDPDGTVESYAWNFGDGDTATGATKSHTYAASGTYTVTLTVTDNRGGTHTTSQDVAVVANLKPTAAFTKTVQFLQASFDGTGSTDSDGTVDTYEWDFGDGNTGSGASPNHAYAAAGTYTVKLTVTDNDGAKDSVTHSVTVESPPPLAADTFTRTVSNGWGTASTGGAWSIVSGPTRFSVADGVAKASIAAGGTGTALLNGVSTSQTDMTFEVSMDKAATGGGTYVSAIGRNVTGAGSYSAKVQVKANGTVAVYLLKTVGGVETVFTSQTVSGLTYTAGEKLKVRLQVKGTDSTALKVKVWKGSDEPSAWALSTTDSTAALQVAGGVGLSSYVSGSSTNVPIVYSFDNLVVPAP